MKRRQFLKNTAMATLGMPYILKGKDRMQISGKNIDAKAYLKEILYTREEIDAWFAGEAFPFSKYHSRFGWLLNSGRFQDGIDHSYSTYTYAGEDGERLMSNYREKPCRINTYGNSYTQCHQVSDHETWQEVLAAHLQEPVRNFGIGGWSVYQAYLRMCFEEQRTHSELIIFNIYEDDHVRNLDSWRNIRANKHPAHIESTLPYVKVDLKNQRMVECSNPCPTQKSFYQLCDLEKTYALFKDDFVLQIMVAHQNAHMENPNKAYQKMMMLSKTHGIETRIDTNETLSKAADTLHRQAGLFSTEKIIEKIDSFAKKNNKKVLYILSYPARYIARSYKEGSRWDQSIIDFIQHKKLPCLDLYQEHINEFRMFKGAIEDYLDRYFIGHYNPLGNFFCAYAFKDKLLEMLDPKPDPYKREHGSIE